MLQVLLYIHVVSAILMGIYLVLPFLLNRVDKLQSGASQFGFLSVLFTTNRVGQFALILSFLTGGYLVSKADYSIVWMVLAVVLFLGIAALSGIMGKRMRLALKESSGSAIKPQLGSIKTLALINGVLFFLTVTLMNFPNWFA
ncbi:hypothetical protein P9314_00290 [Paenibacillus validus]|uniref:DUF2269 family protein n=1 Tax=Paenibacillus validus TaxID=44253 RepID=A0A7X2ZEV8_9BACL|nr:MULTISPECIES: hypothetical protein [Paenibacillus]MED4599151.1 hypothetical protein [Paenibacillus validus]MED4606542.1 hypothetical protein [Paenibacillus validus]MUG73649.1 hypothetical protein [Paenibacillus validus]